MELGLTNSRVLVTGSSRGIGYGIASTFLAEGATVILTGRIEESLQGARSALSDKFGSDRVEIFPGDLGDENIRQHLSSTLRPQGLNHLVCNAGSGRSVPILQETTEEWRRMFDTNLFQATGMVKDLRGLLAASVKQGHGASLTFVGSICGMEAIGCPLAYASAKAALWAYAKNLSGRWQTRESGSIWYRREMSYSQDRSGRISWCRMLQEFRRCWTERCRCDD